MWVGCEVECEGLGSRVFISGVLKKGGVHGISTTDCRSGTGVDSASKRNSPANLTAGGLRLGILAVVIASVGILGLVAVQILMPRPADTEGTLSAAGDTVALSPEGPGLIHVEAVPESEDIQPGAATLVDLLIRGELGKERRSLRFVLFDEDTDLEAEAPPLSERRHLSFSTPGMGKSPELKLMEMKPADSVTLNLTWRSHWVSVFAGDHPCHSRVDRVRYGSGCTQWYGPDLSVGHVGDWGVFRLEYSGRIAGRWGC